MTVALERLKPGLQPPHWIETKGYDAVHHLMKRWMFVMCLGVMPMVSPALAQQIPEPQMEHEVFDRAEVQLLLERLELTKFAERQKAQRALQDMLKASGYPLWHFLINVDATGPGLAETRMRLGRMLNVIDVPDGDKYFVKDWEGGPLPNVFCEVYEMTRAHYLFDAEHTELIGRTVSDAQGRIRIPNVVALSKANLPVPGQKRAKHTPVRALGVIVYAPGYGAAGAVLSRTKREVFFPLVKAGTKPALRSARGVVIDEAGHPIQGVAIHTGSMEIPGLGGFNVRGDSVAFSDHKGRFRVYGWPYNTSNKLVPVGAKFSLRLSVDGFFPRVVESSNDTPKKIVLYRGRQFHRFAFMDGKVANSPNSPLVYHDGDNPPRTRTQLPESYVTAGDMLRTGTYTASFHDGRGYSAKYVPIVVDESSPEELTFKLPPSQSYAGTVYDGITGEPASGVIVFAAYGSKEKNLVDITDEQLASLASMPVDEMAGHPTTAALREVKGLCAITKTDERGRYLVRLDPAEEVYGFYMVSAGMLPYEVRALPADKSKAGENPVVLNSMYRFPAARVRFRPKLPDDVDPNQRVNLWPEWRIDKSIKPVWFERFTDAEQARHGLRGFYPSFYWINAGQEQLGKTQTVTVPAGIKLKLMLRPSSRSGLGPVHFPEPLLMSPSEAIDLGEVDLMRTVPVLVRVVDPDGNPVEGVAVRHRYTSGRSWQVGNTTNLRGEVTVFVAPGLPGEFGAIDILGPAGRLRDENLKVRFMIDRTTNSEDAATCTIQLTNEQVALLPKEGSE